MAGYDIETARAMMKSGRYLYVLFCCQQSIEKMLKALIALRTKEFPPRVHQLVRLAEVAGIELNLDRAQFLRELSGYYIQSRYPEEIAHMASAADRATAEHVLETTEETFKWLTLMQKQ
jgi:HEPN domain-containing protein